MSNRKKSFLLHIDSLEILNDLSDEQAGKLFKAIYSHQIDENIELDQITKMVFLPFRNQFERDNEKYAKTCERRAIAGSKGGKQKVANASKCKQELANVADNKNKNKTKNKSDSDKEVTKDIVAVAPKFNFKQELLNLGVDKDVLNDWLDVRKKKKAANTKTALNGFLTEVTKANIAVADAIKISAENSWSGFKASWYGNLSRQSKANSLHNFSQSTYESGEL